VDFWGGKVPTPEAARYNTVCRPTPP